MIPPKALAAQWQSTHLNSGVEGWRGRVKPLQQDKDRCHGQAPTAAGGEGRNGHQKALLCSRAACSHHQPHRCPAASTMGQGQSAVLPHTASSAPCPGLAVPYHGLGHLGAITVQDGDKCMHPPAIPLLSADQAQPSSRGKFQP